MCGSLSGRESGTHVYEKLAQVHKAKPVYVLSSHSHYYVADNFDTDHWRERFNGNAMAQLLLHYVVAGGAHVAEYFDGRPQRFPPSISRGLG